MKTSLKIALFYLIISSAAVIIFSLSSCSKTDVVPGQISGNTGDSSTVAAKASKIFPVHSSGGYVGPPAYDSTYQTFPDIPRQCPTPGNITIGQVTSNSALVTWSAVPGVDTYTIQYEKVIPNAVITSGQTSDSVFLIRGLKPETLYQCRLQAMRSDGYSNYSPWQLFKTQKLLDIHLEIPIENNLR